MLRGTLLNTALRIQHCALLKFVGNLIWVEGRHKATHNDSAQGGGKVAAVSDPDTMHRTRGSEEGEWGGGE